MSCGRRALTSVGGFHAVSAEVADSWVRTVGIDRRKIRVIPRGVAMTDYQHDGIDKDNARRRIRQEFGYSDETILVVSVGRLEPQKGHRYLVEAMATHELRELDIGLLVVGREGLAAKRVRDAIEKRGMDHRVQLTGPRRDIPTILSAADIFAFPSLFEGNGGNAMIEAMAASLPVITTDGPPMTDLIPNNVVGRLVPRFNVGALSTAINELALDQNLRRSLGSTARARVAGFHNPEQIGEEFASWYRELLGIA